MKKITTGCGDCPHECKNTMVFTGVDDNEYIQSVVETFSCPVVSGCDASWVIIGGVI